MPSYVVVSSSGSTQAAFLFLPLSKLMLQPEVFFFLDGGGASSSDEEEESSDSSRSDRPTAFLTLGFGASAASESESDSEDETSHAFAPFPDFFPKRKFSKFLLM